MFFEEGTKVKEKRQSFQQMPLVRWTFTCKKNESRQGGYTTKLNSKWIYA